MRFAFALTNERYPQQAGKSYRLSHADAPHLKKAALAVEQAACSNLGYLSYSRSHYDYYAELIASFPEYQLYLVDTETNYPVAVANSVPFACSGPHELPAEGWDWLVETAARTKDRTPNMLGGLAVLVPAIHRSKAYSRVIIQALIDLAKSKKLNGVVVPVRPTAKAEHPWVPIADYMSWTDDSGRPYDPSLRSHSSAGGKLIRPCERSMVVREPVGFWENWSKERFERSGDYAIEGARASVKIDLEQSGTYEEPNVWVWYAV